MQLTEKQKKKGREAIEYIEREFGEDAMFVASDMSLKDVVAIKNMWPSRASYIMQVMKWAHFPRSPTAYVPSL